MVSGGAPLNPDIGVFFHAMGLSMLQGYGQTEALPVSMMGPTEWFSEVEGSDPLRSVGRALPFAELQIRDPDGHQLQIVCS